MFPDIPEEILDHYKAKARELPKAAPSPVQELLRKLDQEVVRMLNHNGSQEAYNEAFDAVINHPDSTWTHEVLSYRIRQLYYK